MTQPVKPVKTYPLIDVVAAAIVAFKANGNKIERADSPGYDATEYAEASPAIVSNKTMVMDLLTNSKITEESKAEAAEMIQALQSSVTFKLLTGKKVTPFLADVVKGFDNNEVTYSEIGRNVFVPNLYAGIQAAEKIVELEGAARFTSKSLGADGATVEVNFEMITKRYLEEYGCYAVFGKDDNGNLINFISKHAHLCASGRIKGKVKSSGPDQWHGNAIVSRLNFVKAAS